MSSEAFAKRHHHARIPNPAASLTAMALARRAAVQSLRAQAWRSCTPVMMGGSAPSRALLYTEEQQKKGRPLSPHVTVYKFPPVAISSITVRITGVALSAGETLRAAAGRARMLR